MNPPITRSCLDKPNVWISAWYRCSSCLGCSYKKGRGRTQALIGDQIGAWVRLLPFLYIATPQATDWGVHVADFALGASSYTSACCPIFPPTPLCIIFLNRSVGSPYSAHGRHVPHPPSDRNRTYITSVQLITYFPKMQNLGTPAHQSNYLAGMH